MAIATKPKQRTDGMHKKRTGTHQKRTQSFHKAYWPYLPIALVIAVGLFFNHSLEGGVLSYATDTSRDGLIVSTNQERQRHGANIVSLNENLNQAAQAKAEDMAARNYWSHNTPDGEEPWIFVNQAGYAYQAIGENLAYGFSTSRETVEGWMNSPSHRDNMLNTRYTEVGFGIANSGDFQRKGNQTIVVAMYGQPATTAASIPVTSLPGSSTGEMTVSAVVPDNSERRISRVQVATSGTASWSVFAVTIILAGLVVAFITRHSVAWHRALRKGEQFVLKHKMLDILIVSGIMIAFILTRTAGVIQ